VRGEIEVGGGVCVRERGRKRERKREGQTGMERERERVYFCFQNCEELVTQNGKELLN
jgi:hypothetical protein